jgi:predicted ArsR family transcriptional regulator
MQDPIKVTSTLADVTRFSIYEYMLQHKKYVTVQEIAEEFNIHSNVARLHLTKLAEIGAISAEFLKTGKGGRPGRVYRIKQEGIQLSFPRRDASSLLKWCMQLITQLGDEALQQGKMISYEDGQQTMQKLIASYKNNQSLTFDDKLNILTTSAKLIGYIPEVRTNYNSKSLLFSIFNCPYHDQMAKNGDIVCQLHESYLRGQVDVLFENNEFTQIESMQHHCEFCKYKIEIHN